VDVEEGRGELVEDESRGVEIDKGTLQQQRLVLLVRFSRG
jgi:hypothetical protein